MPRFFFHLAGDGRGEDPEGFELADLAAARAAAVRFFGQSLADHSDAFWSSGDWALTVADAQGLALFTLHAHARDAPSLRQPLPVPRP